LASSVSRAGGFVKQPAGYTAFVPAPLPPDPLVRMDGATVGLLSRADQAVGRLDGVTRTLPNPDLSVLGNAIVLDVALVVFFEDPAQKRGVGGISQATPTHDL
jgi:hypothetical protein